MPAKKKAVVSALIVLLAGMPAFAGEASRAFSISGHATYGPYSESTQREKITSETIKLSWAPNHEAGIGLNLHYADIVRKPPLPTLPALPEIKSTSAGLSLFWVPQLASKHYFGHNATFTYLDVVNREDLTDIRDNNADHAMIPYFSFIYKAPDFSRSFDIGVAYAGYKDTDLHQYTVTAGTFLFNYWVWSQTRAYHIDLSNPVQKKEQTFAFEERMTYYVIPQKLSLTLYALFGERIYAYDSDLGIAYTLPDIQKGGAGLSASYNITPRLNLFGDVTHEVYKNAVINDEFTVLYQTVGLTYLF